MTIRYTLLTALIALLLGALAAAAKACDLTVVSYLLLAPGVFLYGAFDQVVALAGFTWWHSEATDSILLPVACAIGFWIELIPVQLLCTRTKPPIRTFAVVLYLLAICATNVTTFSLLLKGID